MKRYTYSKYADESIKLGWDLINLLPTGASIVGTPTVAVEGDGTMTATYSAVVDSIVYFFVSGGDTSQTDAVVRVTAVTDTPETLVIEINVRVF